MKKLFWSVLIMSLTAYGLYSQNAQAGVIIELTGNVRLKLADSSGFIAANAGDKIALNTIISTGFNSTAVISAGNSIITVYSLTFLSLTGNSSINLQTGRVKVDADTSDNFTVQSPETAAAACGTNFEFNTYNMKVNKGSATLIGASGPAVIVREGREASIGADGRSICSAVSSILSSTPGSSRGSSSGGASSSQQAAGGGGGGGSCCE